MTTSDPNTCPDCDTALPEDSPQHLCPSCLLKQAFASRTVTELSSPQTAPPSPEEITDKFPQFKITECLGRGGMGVVYKARQKSLNRWVAIKILAPEKIDDEKFSERFAREAQTLAQLNHPNIVTVHDYGETDGLYYIVMEFIDGVNLRDLLHDGKIDSAQALTIVPPICEALQYAHDKGIVHRDIKPENLLIDRDGRVKIADFGIASLIGDTDEKSGTPPYMAPEQGNHENVDHRADIYALGAVLYEMLTGERPASPLDLPSKKVQLDIRIDDIVLRALSKEPERRYRTANEFRTVVETISNGDTPKLPTPDPAPTTPNSSIPTKKRSMFRRWWWILLIMIPVATILGVLLTALITHLSPKEYESRAVIQIRPSEHKVTSGAYEAHLSNLTSTQLLTQVSQHLDLPKQWMVSETNAVSRIEQSLSIQQLRGTDLFEIRVRITNNKEAALIANTLSTLYSEEQRKVARKPKTPPLFNSPQQKKLWEKQEEIRQKIPKTPVTIHEEARPASRPVSPSWRKRLFIAVPASFILSPLLGLIVMSLLHRFFPARSPVSKMQEPSEEQQAKTAFYGKVALWLFLAGTLGTLAMMTLSSRHDMALIFGGVALFLAIVFGLMSKKRGVVIALIVIIVLGAILTALSAVIFYYRLSSSKSIALENMRRAELSAMAAQTAVQENAQNTEEDFERVARLHMEAISRMDLKAARTFWFRDTKLTKRKDTQTLQDFKELNSAYKKNPALLTTFSEWHRTGGYVLARVTPPENGDGQSIYLILINFPEKTHHPKEWKIVDINDIRQDELLSDKFDQYIETLR